MLAKDRDELVLNNQRLIYHILNRKFAYDFLDEEDLYAEGCIALLEAAEKYEPSKGAFSTLAYVCILRRLWRYVEKEKAKRQYEVSRYACRESFDFTVRDLLDSICDPNVDVEGEVLSKIFMDEILDSLPERTRHILEEYCAGKMKTQIASEMNLNYYHLVNICRSARERLLRTLK